MVVLNLTKKTKITDNLIAVNSLRDKVFGLLRKSNSRSLFFKTRFGVHTLGLKNPIDILVLDDKLKVVKIGQAIKPNKLFFWHPKYLLVFELPFGAIERSETEIGDRISLH